MNIRSNQFYPLSTHLHPNVDRRWREKKQASLMKKNFNFTRNESVLLRFIDSELLYNNFWKVGGKLLLFL